MKPPVHFSVALAGNPNVGKSTLYNALTHAIRRQHTGNWSGKTVGLTSGHFTYQQKRFSLTDLPGTLSLNGSSPEQKIAADALKERHFDAVVCIIDACAPSRGLALALQIMEITSHVVLCVNFIDAAQKRHITIQVNTLSKLLGVPVVCTKATGRFGREELKKQILSVCEHPPKSTFHVLYPQLVQDAVDALLPHLPDSSTRRTARNLLAQNAPVPEALTGMVADLHQANPDLTDSILLAPMRTAERLTAQTITIPTEFPAHEQRLDALFTGKITGKISILVLLFLVLWLTLFGANIISDLLGDFLFGLQKPLAYLLSPLPPWLTSLLCDGVYRTLAWVVSVMLPPLLIFFPLFGFLEELGFLPRMAFHLDHTFCKAGSCGKQALTVCMGFGCNAAGITGCRIMNTKKEQDIAMLTNAFTPCNGKFPMLISIFTLFFLGNQHGVGEEFLAAAELLLILLFSFLMTLLTSRLLSKFLHKEKTTFTLEMPPYRKPNLPKLLKESLWDKTLRILLRAMVSATFAGVILWICTNTQIEGVSLLHHITEFLDPFAHLLGLDGVILTAFLLGLPANEIVMPIIIMTYTAGSSLMELQGAGLYALLTQNGWTIATAVCVLLFTLFHFPCATSIITLYKESHSIKSVLIGILLPTICGILCCMTAAALFTWI